MHRVIVLCRSVVLYGGSLAASLAGLLAASRLVVAGRPTAGELAGWIAQPLTPWTLTAIAVGCGWALWAALAMSCVRRARSHLARYLTRTRAWQLPPPLRALAAVVLGAAAVSTAAGPAVAASPAAAAGPDLSLPGHDDPHRPSSAAGDTAVTASGESVTVRAGDSLFGIAARELGDGDRWPEIFEINRGSAGSRLTNPHLIRPGLTLTLPTGTAERAPEEPAPPRARPAPEPPVSTPEDTTACGTPSTGPHETTAPSGAGTDADAHDGAGVELATGSWVGIGLAAAVVVTATTVWTYRRVRYVPRTAAGDGLPAGPRLAPLPRIIADLRHGLRTRRITSRPAAPQAADDPATAESPDGLAGMAWPDGGLGLTGPGAAAAARGLLVAAHATTPPGSPHRTIITAEAADQLFGTDAPVSGAFLTIAVDLPAALLLIEAEALQRIRYLQDHDVADADEPAGPAASAMPPALLISAVSDTTTAAHLTAVLTQVAPLRIRGLLLGAHDAGTTLHVDADGTTGSGSGTSPAAVRLTVLQPAEALDLLRVLTEAGDTSPEQDSTPHPHSVPQNATGADPDTVVEEQPEPEDAHAPASPVAPTADAAAAEPTGERRAVRIDVLGGARIHGVGPEQHLRAKSLELLVYLAAHDGTATDAALLEDLIPDARLTQAPPRLHTYVYGLRQALRHAGGQATYLDRGHQRYTLTPGSVDIDLWRMRAALRDADNALDPHARIDALRRAVGLYTGPLADGLDYEWIEPYREAARRQAVDAHTALADALTDQPAEQLKVLLAAIRYDTYTEAHYQRAMRAHAALGQHDAIPHLLHALARALGDIDTTPSAETRDLAAALTPRPRPRPTRRRAGVPS